MRQIKTQYEPQCVPFGDWYAWLDGQEELGAGSGRTEQEAIKELINLLFPDDDVNLHVDDNGNVYLVE